jgi:hypothetical protein
VFNLPPIFLAPTLRYLWALLALGLEVALRIDLHRSMSKRAADAP